MPVTGTVISKVKEMAKKQGITESKFHNEDTDLNFPNADWEFSEEHEEDDEDCECQSQDDIECDRDVSNVEMEELFSDQNNNHIENQEIGQQQ